MVERERMIIGRSYIETLIINLTQIEFSTQDPDVIIRIVSRLEEEVCGLSTSIPELKIIYTSRFKELIKEYFGHDLPIPDSIFSKCFIIENMLEYLLRNPYVVLGEKRYITTEAERRIKNIVGRLSKSALLVALYSTGLIKVF